jgi:hypothetical protein
VLLVLYCCGQLDFLGRHSSGPSVAIIIRIYMWSILSSGKSHMSRSRSSAISGGTCFRCSSS